MAIDHVRTVLDILREEEEKKSKKRSANKENASSIKQNGHKVC